MVEERAACSCPGAGKNYRARPITGRSYPFENTTLSSATRDADANAREWLLDLSQKSRDLDHCHHRDAWRIVGRVAVVKRRTTQTTQSSPHSSAQPTLVDLHACWPLGIRGPAGIAYCIDQSPLYFNLRCYAGTAAPQPPPLTLHYHPPAIMSGRRQPFIQE